jgi:hypothetical protein
VDISVGARQQWDRRLNGGLRQAANSSDFEDTPGKATRRPPRVTRGMGTGTSFKETPAPSEAASVDGALLTRAAPTAEDGVQQVRDAFDDWQLW